MPARLTLILVRVLILRMAARAWRKVARPEALLLEPEA